MSREGSLSAASFAKRLWAGLFPSPNTLVLELRLLLEEDPELEPKPGSRLRLILLAPPEEGSISRDATYENHKRKVKRGLGRGDVGFEIKLLTRLKS